MNTAKKIVGEVFGFDRVGDAIVYAGLDRDYRRDVASPDYVNAASRIVDTWKLTSAPSLGDVEGAVEAMADKLIDLDLMRSARLDAQRRRRHCLVEDIQVPALCGKTVAVAGKTVEPQGKTVAMQLEALRSFVREEATRHLG